MSPSSYLFSSRIGCRAGLAFLAGLTFLASAEPLRAPMRALLGISSSRQAQPGALDSSSSSASPATPAKPKYWKNADRTAQVTVKEDTLFRVLTNGPLNSRQNRAGSAVHFTLSEDVVVDGTVIIPKGASILGTIVESKTAGTLTGSPDLVLKLTSLELDERSYPLYTYLFKVVGGSKTQPTKTKIEGGAAIGALAGAALSGNARGTTTGTGKLAGMGAGAALGAGAGALVSAASPGPMVSFPAESEMDFYLASPISVVPATEEQAIRLSSGLNHGGPVLYVRGERP